MNPSGFFIVKIMALFGEPLFVLQCSLPTSKAGDKGTAFLGYIHLSTISHRASHYMHEKPTLVHFLITTVRRLAMKKYGDPEIIEVFAFHCIIEE